jgi:hypothetical protein
MDMGVLDLEEIDIRGLRDAIRVNLVTFPSQVQRSQDIADATCNPGFHASARDPAYVETPSSESGMHPAYSASRGGEPTAHGQGIPLHVHEGPSRSRSSICSHAVLRCESFRHNEHSIRAQLNNSLYLPA